MRQQQEVEEVAAAAERERAAHGLRHNEAKGEPYDTNFQFYLQRNTLHSLGIPPKHNIYFLPIVCRVSGKRIGRPSATPENETVKVQQKKIIFREENVDVRTSRTKG